MEGINATSQLRAGWRKLALLATGAVLVIAAVAIQDARLPETAPLAVQARGYAKLRAILAHVAASDFGRRERGARLTAILEHLLETDRICFSATLGGPRAQLYSRLFHRPLLYVRILRPGEDRWLHQLPHQLAEAVYHEAVHFARGGLGQASFEEECDAFLAGLDAEAILLDIPPPDHPTIDGMTVAAFVRQAYPHAPRNPRYRPIGKDRDWLLKRARGAEPNNDNGRRYR